MISFYPGPSRVYPKIPRYVQDAYSSGVLSVNHRSKEFMELYASTVEILREKLGIPKSYAVIFTSSATENWEILAQSLTRHASFHIFSGAFGEKWFNYASHFHPGNRKYTFDLNQELELDQIKIPLKSEMICLTQNETSNGTSVSMKFLRKLRKTYPDPLICVDATSSMGGQALDFNAADAWFASVQKCFGLPAGMGILICSPKLIEKARKIGERGKYNSFNTLYKNYEKWQTSYTPNVLSIYLLKRVMEANEGIREVEKKLEERYQNWVEIFSQSHKFRLLVENEKVRSKTVIAVSGSEKEIEKVKSRARRNKLLIGAGYGDLKPVTFRIANFPALKNSEVQALIRFFRKYEK